MRWWDEECFDEFDIVDPLQHERTVPVDDAEADRIEELCRTATPGPFTIDDCSDGEGTLIATLPDGRLIVSQRAEVLGEEEGRAALEANAQVICRARCIVLRMIHDRQCWREREQSLVSRIERLESELDKVRSAAQQELAIMGEDAQRRPR